PLKRGEVVVDGGGGGEADILADLTDRRRVPTLAHVPLDHLEDLALAGSERDLGHAGHRTGVRAGCQTPVRRACVRRHLDGERPFVPASRTPVRSPRSSPMAAAMVTAAQIETQPLL